MRLFVGTFIDPEIFEYQYEELIDDFSGITNGKWVEKENIHFTWKFIGDYDDNRLNEVKNALKPHCVSHELPIVLKGIKVMPNIKRPRVLYVPFYSTGASIIKIHAGIENALLPLGIEKEKRPFKQHITLQRPKALDIAKFKDINTKYNDFEFGQMQSFRVNLIQSVLTKSGPVYKKLL